MRHPCGRLAGKLETYDALVTCHRNAYVSYLAARTDDDARRYYRAVEEVEQMLSYCPEHRAVVEAVRIVGEAAR